MVQESIDVEDKDRIEGRDSGCAEVARVGCEYC